MVINLFRAFECNDRLSVLLEVVHVGHQKLGQGCHPEAVPKPPQWSKKWHSNS